MKPRILIAHKDNKGFIRIEVAGTHESAHAFKAVCHDMLAKGVTEIAIDLQACERLDSTFCGTLLSVAIRIKEAGQKAHIYIFNVNESVKNTLLDLGLDRFFIFKNGDPMK